MNFGEKLKQIRTERNMTQPQFADAIGIEQSYLSKLENDKSSPSAEMFQTILQKLSLNAQEFLKDIDHAILNNGMRQIPEVAQYLNLTQKMEIHHIKRWLYSSAAACVIGTTLIVAGGMNWVFPNKMYNYTSDMVLLNGEPSDLYFSYPGYIRNSKENKDLSEAEIQIKIAEFKTKRIHQQSLSLNEYRGKQFEQTVENGKRIFYKDGEDIIIQRKENNFLMLLGTLMCFAALFGFILEACLRKKG
jgi:transcriptional regulator with XRE-family HTH domain